MSGLSDTDHNKQYAMPVYGPASARPTGPWRKGRIYVAEDTRVISYDTGGGWVEHMPKEYMDELRPRLRVPHTFTVSGEVKVPSGDDFYIPPFFVDLLAGAQSVSIANVRSRINSGTSATFEIRKNGTATGVGSAATTTPTSTGQFAATLADGDLVSLVVTAVSGTPKNLSVTVFLDYIGVLV